MRERTVEPEAAKPEAEPASRAKSDLRSSMSHQLRTPMHAVLGFSQWLQMEPPASRQAGDVHQIQEPGDRLLHLINDLLDLGKIDAGRLLVVPTAVALAGAPDQAERLVRALVGEQGETLKCN